MSAEVTEAVPERGCFINVNTPEELAHIEATIMAEGIGSRAIVAR